MPERCLARPPFACPAASAVSIVAPLSLSSRVPWLRRADSGRRAGPAAASAWCGWRRFAPARGGPVAGANRIKELNRQWDSGQQPWPAGRVAAAEAGVDDRDVAAGGIVTLEAVGSDAIEIAHKLDGDDHLAARGRCLRRAGGTGRLAARKPRRTSRRATSRRKARRRWTRQSVRPIRRLARRVRSTRRHYLSRGRLLPLQMLPASVRRTRWKLSALLGVSCKGLGAAAGHVLRGVAGVWAATRRGHVRRNGPWRRRAAYGDDVPYLPMPRAARWERV